MKSGARRVLTGASANGEWHFGGVLAHNISPAVFGKVNLRGFTRTVGQDGISYTFETVAGDTHFVHAPNEHFEGGGSSANAAVALAMHGMEVTAVLGLGPEADPTRCAIIDILEAHQVVCVPYMRAQQSAVTFVLPGYEGQQRNETLFCFKPAVDPEFGCALEGLKGHTFDVVDLSGVRRADIPFVRAIFRVQRGAYRAFSPNVEILSLEDRQTLVQCTRMAHLVSLNEAEARLILGEEIERARAVEQMKELRKRLRIQGKRKLLVTRGVNGAWLAYENKKRFFLLRQKAYRLPGEVHTTGAGDAFRAAFLAARMMGCSRKGALAHAARYAAEKIKTAGGTRGHPPLNSIREWETLPPPH